MEPAAQAARDPDVHENVRYTRCSALLHTISGSTAARFDGPPHLHKGKRNGSATACEMSGGVGICDLRMRLSDTEGETSAVVDTLCAASRSLSQT